MTIIFKDKKPSSNPGQDVSGLTDFIPFAETRQQGERRNTRRNLGLVALTAVTAGLGTALLLGPAQAASQEFGQPIGITAVQPDQSISNPVDRQIGGDPIPASNQQNTTVGGDQVPPPEAP